jgi:acetylornithine/succinyldiaminopimelate/putrescine aminotransferase
LGEHAHSYVGELGLNGDALCRTRSIASAAQGASLVDFGKKHVTKGLSRHTDSLVTKGEGSYMHFADGRKMLDFTTGIGVTVLGEAPPPTSSVLVLTMYQATVIPRSARLPLISA